MNFVKKNLKWIITIIGVIIATTGISVYATGQYLASQIIYKDEKTVEQALNELYKKQSNKTTGELFLELLMKKELVASHNYENGYTAYAEIANLDFSNIKSIRYQFNVNTNNSGWQSCFLYDNVGEKYIFYDTSSNSATANINGANNVNFSLRTSSSGSNTFKILSYQTMDGITHN